MLIGCGGTMGCNQSNQGKQIKRVLTTSMVSLPHPSFQPIPSSQTFDEHATEQWGTIREPRLKPELLDLGMHRVGGIVILQRYLVVPKSWARTLALFDVSSDAPFIHVELERVEQLTFPFNETLQQILQQFHNQLQQEITSEDPLTPIVKNQPPTSKEIIKPKLYRLTITLYTDQAYLAVLNRYANSLDKLQSQWMPLLIGSLKVFIDPYKYRSIKVRYRLRLHAG